MDVNENQSVTPVSKKGGFTMAVDVLGGNVYLLFWQPLCGGL